MLPSSNRPLFARTLVTASALTVLLSLQSCCTMLLWGYEQRCVAGDDEDDDHVQYVAIEGTQWEWWRVLLRIAFTPLTLAVDVGITISAGALVLDDDDDDDDDDGDDDDDCRSSSSRCASHHATPSPRRPAAPWSPSPSAPSASSGTVQRRSRRPGRRRTWRSAGRVAAKPPCGCCPTALRGCTVDSATRVAQG